MDFHELGGREGDITSTNVEHFHCSEPTSPGEAVSQTGVGKFQMQLGGSNIDGSGPEERYPNAEYVAREEGH